MFDAAFDFINEEFYACKISPSDLDRLLADGWRHFGKHFFRYSFGSYNFEIRKVIPLRIRLADFSFSKSHRRIINKNSGLRSEIRPIEITPEMESLFARHRQRFKFGVPDSIFNFVSPDTANMPCKALEMCVLDGDRLLAASFFDVGENSMSGIYAMFEPFAHRRSLGIYTMLKEIEFAVKKGKEFYYQGYSYEGNSFYDYKKNFTALETYDWNGKWHSLT